MYVGAGRYIYEDIWALMLMKNDSSFVRDMAETLWCKAVLLQRCIRQRKPNNELNSEIEENHEDEDSLKPLTPEKYQLVKGS